MEKKRLIELGEFLNKSVFDGSLKTNDAFAEGIILFTQESVAFLKEQEPVKAKDCADIVDGIQVGYCPKCDRKIVWNPEKEETVAFCKYCEQAVKLDD